MSPSPPGRLRTGRRGLLRGGLTAGAALGLGRLCGGCAYLPGDEPAVRELPASAKAEIDGDLVYFNWADYLDPSVLAGFEREYDVRIIESNFDSMEGMYAKLNAGNRYDIVFPIAKWVARLRREGKIRAIDHARLSNADQVFHSGSYFNDPWYDARSRASVPFTVYRTGIGYRTDKVSGLGGSWRDLWLAQAAGRICILDDQDEALAVGALMLGYDVNTSVTAELEEIRKLLISQKQNLRAYSSDDINNMVSGNAWIHHMWSGDFLYLKNDLAEDPAIFDFEAPVEGTPINSDAYCIPADAEHPGTAMVFIDYLLRPEIARKNIRYLCYPMPVRDAQDAFDSLSREVPAARVDVTALENPHVFRLLDSEAVHRRTAVWTDVKAS